MGLIRFNKFAWENYGHSIFNNIEHRSLILCIHYNYSMECKPIMHRRVPLL